jgi:hypothetical protein
MIDCRQYGTHYDGLIKFLYLDFIEYVLGGQPQITPIFEKILNLNLSVLKLSQHILASLVHKNCSADYLLINEIN